MSSLLLKEMPLAVYQSRVLKKASLINDSFISEVKSRWRPRRRGGCLSPPRKLHGKNISKCISKMVLKKEGVQNALQCFHNVVSQRRSLKKEFRMYWFA